MRETVIRVEGLGKKYHIGKSQGSYLTLRDTIANAAGAPFRRAWSLMRGRAYGAAQLEEELWALKEVSFEVEEGEILGVIGSNGAGKSTLLRVLTRITEPSEGRAGIRGRVGALLEVGTGTHPELTGRENIYLASAVIGMKRSEVNRKFDEIVDFAGIGKFLDTPVKHYSDGMRVRLGFSVAAHLEPEILLIDEVLAVGDAAFQKKCLGKMESVAGGGRTVLLVSHNMQAIGGLCQKAIWLEKGRIRSVGPALEMVAEYSMSQLETAREMSAASLGASNPIVVKDVRLLNEGGEAVDAFEMDEGITVEMDIAQTRLDEPVRLCLRVRSTEDNSVVLATTDWNSDNPVRETRPGEYTVQCRIPGNLFNEGGYSLTLGIDIPRGPVLLQLENVRRFIVVNASSMGDGIYGRLDGALSPYREWRLVSSRMAEEE